MAPGENEFGALRVVNCRRGGWVLGSLGILPSIRCSRRSHREGPLGWQGTSGPWPLPSSVFSS